MKQLARAPSQRASSLAALVMATLSLMQCETPSLEDCEPLEAEVSLVSYNLANRTGSAREPIIEILDTALPDFMALQECLDCDELQAAMPRFALSENRRAGVAIMFDASRWMPVDEDVLRLGIDDDGWGERVMHWVRFRELTSGSDIVVASTHFCVPIRNDQDRCTDERLVQYAERSLEHLNRRVGPHCPILFAGDLNLFGDQARDEVRAVFADAGYADLFAMAPFADSEPSFVGNSWAPQARLDFVFSRYVPSLRSALVERSDLARSASDHFPLIVQVGAELEGDALASLEGWRLRADP